MDVDFPGRPRFIKVKKRHKALLKIDEAHSIGVLGRNGRGIGEHFDLPRSDVRNRNSAPILYYLASQERADPIHYRCVGGGA